MKKFCLLFLLFWGRLILAVSDSHQSASINWWGLGSAYKNTPALGWLIITFLLFIFALVWVIRKPLGLYLETRSRDIRKQIEEGKQAKIIATEKLRLYEEKLKSLDSEIEKIKTQFKNQARVEAQEKERLRKDAEAKILRDVDDTIKSQLKRTKYRLAEEVVELALQKATQTLLQQDKQALDERLGSKLLADLKAESGATQ